MKLNYAKQIDFKDLSDITFDIFIMATSHEERFETLNNREDIKFNKKIILSYSSDYSCTHDDKTKFYPVESGDFVENVITMLDNELSNITYNENIKILIDYSSMTKTWYYTIMSYFSIKDLKYQNVSLYFSYTPSIFSEPLSPKHNSIIEPIPGKFKMPSSEKPKALIVGLGYENKKAEGIIEYLDPKLTYALYSKPASDDRFVTAVEDSNKNLIKELNENVITFPFDDLLTIERVLTSLYFSLREDYDVIIAPLGPKPFSFIAMLLSIKFENIDVWRVSSGNDFNKYPRVALQDQFIVCEVVFTNP